MLKYLLTAGLLAGGCHSGTPADSAHQRIADPDRSTAGCYNLTRPAATYTVPPELLEISGQTWAGPDQLACIEDESGSLFFYNLRTQRLDSTVRFGESGDYEDVTRLPDGWLILRSDGVLFKRTGRVTTTYATGLTIAHEPEGLTYDAATNVLLVVCKGAPGAGLPNTQRAVYRLDPVTYHIGPTPAFTLNIPAILARAPLGADQPAKKVGRPSRFAPSALAIHPRNHHVFVLSARGNNLVELDPQGRLVDVQTLDLARFPQPEGLAFAPNGDLFISSEAGSNRGQGRLYRFQEKPAQP
jgi:hypothetical protein